MGIRRWQRSCDRCSIVLLSKRTITSCTPSGSDRGVLAWRDLFFFASHHSLRDKTWANAWYSGRLSCKQICSKWRLSYPLRRIQVVIDRKHFFVVHFTLKACRSLFVLFNLTSTLIASSDVRSPLIRIRFSGFSFIYNADSFGLLFSKVVGSFALATADSPAGGPCRWLRSRCSCQNCCGSPARWVVSLPAGGTTVGVVTEDVIINDYSEFQIVLDGNIWTMELAGELGNLNHWALKHLICNDF